jgi:hypothetical protein
LTQNFDAKSHKGLSGVGEQVFEGQTLAAQPRDDRADDMHERILAVGCYQRKSVCGALHAGRPTKGNAA